MEVKERKENYMKKNSFSQAVVIAIAAVCIIRAVVMINVSNESEKCIKSGCDNYKAYESEYCYTHKPNSKKSKSSETPSYNNKSSDSSSGEHSSNSTDSSSNSYTDSNNYTNKSTSGSGSSYQSYDDGYDDVYMDDDYDDERYENDKDYADGVDDAMDESDEDW